MKPSFQLPGYEILEKIGEGGMAIVWKARQISLDRIVAIKVFTADTKDLAAVDRFRLEAQAAAKFKHPGIVRVYDAGEHQGMFYYVMEYISGYTVAALIERKNYLPENLALRIAKGVAQVLRDAWKEAKLVHCDIKPDNVLVDQDGSIRVADLGLSLVKGLGSTAADHDTFVGTPNYCSPEQIRGGVELDFRTDIYALGAMLYHMLTGKVPFGRKTGTEAMDAQLNDYLPDPVEINAELKTGVSWLLEKMMVKNRDRRYKDWGSVVEDIDLVMQGTRPNDPLPAVGESTIERGPTRATEVIKPTPSVDSVIAALASQDMPKMARKTTQRGGAAKTAPKRPLAAPAYSPPPVKVQSSTSTSSFFIFLLTLGGIAIAAYFFWQKFKNERQRAPQTERQEVMKQLPPRSTVTISKDGNNWATQSDEPVRQPKPTASSGASAPPGITWQDPFFLQGANAFNSALAKYLDYHKTRTNPGVLKEVQKQCKDAVAAFQACDRKNAPANVNIDELIRQCNNLIFDCHQSTTLGAMSPGGAGTSSASIQQPPPHIVIQPIVKAEEPPLPISSNGLTLAPNWNEATKSSSPVVSDLDMLLKNMGAPTVNLKGDPSIVLYDAIRYLTSVADAARSLGCQPGVRHNVDSPIFPANSFSFYILEGTFKGGFTRLLLIADPLDHVVGVQLEGRFPPKKENGTASVDPRKTDWYCYNIVRESMRGDGEKVLFRSLKKGPVVLLNSELRSVDDDEPNAVVPSVLLILPQPVVDVILARLEILRKS